MSTSSHDRLSALSPAKRAVVEQQLAQRQYRAQARRAGLGHTSGPGPFPVSYDQERLWLLDQLDSGYVVTRVLRIRGPLDTHALGRAFDLLVERHEALRTRFRLFDGTLMQEIVPASTVTIERIEIPLSAHCPSALLTGALGAVRAIAERPFDLDGGNLLRVALAQFGDDDHLLAVVVHHLASDDGSKAVLFRELSESYNAFRAGTDPAMPVPAHRYADFAVWQRDRLERDGLHDTIAAWRRQLDGAPAVIDLPLDRPRPAASTGRGERVHRALPEVVVDQLRTVATGQRATLFSAMTAVYGALLCQLTGQEDIVVGTPVAGRTVPGLDDVIGFFANTLVLRLDLSGDPTFLELVAKTQAVVSDALDRQELPFQRLVEELNPARDLAVSPVFQVMLTVEDGRPLELHLDGCDVEVVNPDQAGAKFDWTISVIQRSSTWELMSEWSSDVIDQATVARWLDWFERLLAAVVDQPDVALSRLPMISREDEQELARWGTGPEVMPGPLVVEQFEAVVAAQPDAVAVIGASGRLTYRDLDHQSRALARHLASLGVGRGDLVGVCLNRDVRLPVALWAIVRAGAGYVPVDPDYPDDRTEAILSDARVSVVVTESACLDRLPVRRATTVQLDLDAGAIARAPETELPVPEPDDVAYVIFTSGSTGRPKGVRLPHRALANCVSSLRASPGLRPDDVLLGVTTPAFDLSVPDWFLPATTGACLVIAEADRIADGEALARLIDTQRVTVMQATPATWRLLVESGWAGSPQLRVWCGGESWGEKLADQLHARCAEVWNMYGPTETCVWSAAARVEPGQPVRIAGPLNNTRLVILDRHDRSSGLGCPGELCIGGDGVALGYHALPELTAERFVPDLVQPSRSMYRTGDLARWRNDGTIEFLGRLDHQVKLRGHRVELGEIEAALTCRPGVDAAVVVLSEIVEGDPQLVAYVQCPHSGTCETPAELRSALVAVLPSYMVPATFVVLDALPLTPNGKVDRARLPDPTATDWSASSEYEPPSDLLEQTVVAIWQEVLNRTVIGRSDSFFELGGHSLSAVRMFAEIERRCGVRLPLATIFKGATVAAIAAEIREREGDQRPWRSLVMLRPGTGSGPALFLCPMLGGEVFSWRDLVRHLSESQTVYGLQALGLDGRDWPLRSIEAMAAHFIAEMRTVHPHGPFLLGGFCFGGAVALEMAHQLVRAGEDVALLALVDVSRHVAAARTSAIDAHRHKLEKFRSQGKGGVGSWIVHRANNVRVKAIKRVWWSVYDRYERSERDLPRRMQNVRWVNQRAIDAWDAPPSPCRVTLFRRQSLALESSFYRGSLRDKLATRGLDELVIGDAALDHVDLIREPAVRELAQAFTDVIEQCSRRSDGGSPVPSQQTHDPDDRVSSTPRTLEA